MRFRRCSWTAAKRKLPRPKKTLRLENLEPRLSLSGGGIAAGYSALLTPGSLAVQARSPQPGAPVTLADVGDTYAMGGTYASGNFGKLAYLEVRQDANPSNNCQAYVKFDVSSFSGPVNSAILTLTPVARGANLSAMTIRVRLLPDAADGWIEGAGGINTRSTGPLTWNNRPAGTGLAVTVSGAALAAGSVPIDVTPLLNQGLSGNGTVSFQIDVASASGPQSYVCFASREAAAASRPTLLVSGQANQAPTVATAASAASNPVAGTTTQLAVLGADDGGEANLRYTWSVIASPGGAAAPRFSDNGTHAAQNVQVTFYAAGTYGFRATITDAGGASTTSDVVVVVNQTLRTVVLTPSSATVQLNGTQQFAATGYDQFGNRLAAQPAFAWTATAGSITPTGGLFTAPATAASVTVRASSGSVSGTAAVTVNSTFLNLKNVALADLTKTLFTRDGAINRLDMIQLLESVVQDNVVDANELSDLNTILSDASTLKIPGYVQVLAGDVVDGSPANARYQGQALGNLAAGSNADLMTKLVNKWFLGKDHPTPDQGSYRVVSGSLFGTGGPVLADMHQGQVGDCYFISALGAIAKTSPAAVRNMFLDNGDNTWTIRYYYNGVADYVTVDKMLPVDSSNDLIYADWQSYYGNSSNVLWIPLAEKAYAEWNEVGHEYQDGTNTYAGISGGWMGYVDAQVLGHDSQDYGLATNSDKQALIDAITGNKAVTICTNVQTSDGLVGNHAYAVIGYSSSSRLFVLRNPWGFQDPPSLNWSQLQADCEAFAVADASGTVSITALPATARQNAPPVGREPAQAPGAVVPEVLGATGTLGHHAGKPLESLWAAAVDNLFAERGAMAF